MPADQPRWMSQFALAAFWIASSHLLVDACANAIPAVQGQLEVRCGLTPLESAWFAAIGALASGLCQPLFAWLSDRLNTRLFAGLGMACLSLCFCNLGYARSPMTLFAIYGVGMLGVAMYHPIAAASMGQLLPGRRAALVSLFFVSGMAGSALGALGGPYLADSDDGFAWLSRMTVPGIVVAWILHLAIAKLPHRAAESEPGRARPELLDNKRWLVVVLLYFSSVMKFAVNLALFYLYLRWLTQDATGLHPDWNDQQVSDYVAPTLGQLIAVTQFGMGLGGIGSGLLLRPGREKWALVGLPCCFAPMIVSIPLVPFSWAYPLSLLAGIGFAGSIPVSITVAQRLMPDHPSMASGLMLGGAWSLAMVAPPVTQVLLDFGGIQVAFLATSFLLLASGLLLTLAPGRIFQLGLGLADRPHG